MIHVSTESFRTGQPFPLDHQTRKLAVERDEHHWEVMTVR